jgi:DNA-binding MurR/RpiR family transcriptional regulator
MKTVDYLDIKNVLLDNCVQMAWSHFEFLLSLYHPRILLELTWVCKNSYASNVIVLVMAVSKSIYETNFLKLYDMKFPQNIYQIVKGRKRVYFVGTGSSFWISGISEFLCKKYLDRIELDIISVTSFDFVRSRFLVSTNDIVVVFSHRAGPNTISIRALDKAKAFYRATTILVTGIDSPNYSKMADLRIETCSHERSEAYTISVTSAIVRIIQLLGMFNNNLLEAFEDYIECFEIATSNTNTKIQY